MAVEKFVDTVDPKIRNKAEQHLKALAYGAVDGSRGYGRVGAQGFCGLRKSASQMSRHHTGAHYAQSIKQFISLDTSNQLK